MFLGTNRRQDFGCWSKDIKWESAYARKASMNRGLLLLPRLLVTLYQWLETISHFHCEFTQHGCARAISSACLRVDREAAKECALIRLFKKFLDLLKATVHDHLRIMAILQFCFGHALT
jgi:hypothetical protein